jgi:hypothetical protein
MHKKLMLACMAIAAFAAFVIAPAAQAAVLTENGVAVLPHPSGKTCAEDSTGCITATNTGITKFTGGFGVECEVAHLQGVVTKNSEGVIKGTIAAETPIFKNKETSTCGSLLGPTAVKVTSELCLEVPKGSDAITVTGCGGVVTFDLTAGGITCRYETPSVSGAVETNKTPAVSVVSEQKATEEKATESFFCPNEGKLDMTFDIYTEGGTVGLTVS